MSADLGVGQSVGEMTATGFPPRRGKRQGDSSSLADVVAWTKFALSIVLGVALAAVNLLATTASGWLRVPALLAALILCAQGPVDLGKYNRRKALDAIAAQAAREEEERRKPEGEGDVPGQVLGAEEEKPAPAAGSATDEEIKEYERQAKKEEVRERATVGAAAESRPGLITVLILAIWLGLATLNYSSAPPLLLWLSTIASFLLFMSVWGGLQEPAAT